MSSLERLLLLGLGTAVAVWLGLLAYLLIGRALYDLRLGSLMTRPPQATARPPASFAPRPRRARAPSAWPTEATVARAESPRPSPAHELVSPELVLINPELARGARELLPRPESVGLDLGPVSPELVLVDPELARVAREQLPEPETVAAPSRGPRAPTPEARPAAEEEPQAVVVELPERLPLPSPRPARLRRLKPVATLGLAVVLVPGSLRDSHQAPRDSHQARPVRAASPRVPALPARGSRFPGISTRPLPSGNERSRRRAGRDDRLEGSRFDAPPRPEGTT